MPDADGNMSDAETDVFILEMDRKSPGFKVMLEESGVRAGRMRTLQTLGFSEEDAVLLEVASSASDGQSVIVPLLKASDANPALAAAAELPSAEFNRRLAAIDLGRSTIQPIVLDTETSFPMLDAAAVLARADALYAEAVLGNDYDGYKAPEQMPRIQSRGLRAAITALVETLNERAAPIVMKAGSK